MTDTRIYLDHAATGWPKPDSVVSAMDDFVRDCGASAGRSAYKSAQRAGAVVARARRQAADLINAPSANDISFHASGTAALNAAIHGVLRPGDHVVTTSAEHNSVLRPLEYLRKTIGIRVTTVACDQTGAVASADVADALQDDTRLIAVTHASNVTGAVQPIAAIGDLIRDHQALFLCDAAQTFGYLPIDVQQFGVDLLATPGHKGGLGPMGTGLLFATPQVQEQIVPLFQGGTGSASESLSMPNDYPSKLEAGNLNVPAIAGWSAGLEELGERIASFSGAELAMRLHAELSQIPVVGVFGSPGPLPIISLQVDGLTPSDAAAILDAEFNIETRAGLHCAALIHRYLESGVEGTLRISGGHETTHQEIETVCDALAAIALEVA